MIRESCSTVEITLAIRDFPEAMILLFDYVNASIADSSLSRRRYAEWLGVETRTQLLFWMTHSPKSHVFISRRLTSDEVIDCFCFRNDLY